MTEAQKRASKKYRESLKVINIYVSTPDYVELKSKKEKESLTWLEALKKGLE